MSFAGSHRQADIATGGETIWERVLNRPAANPKLLPHSAKSRVNTLTEFAKKPECFQPMLTTALPETRNWATLSVAADGRDCIQLKREGT